MRTAVEYGEQWGKAVSVEQMNIVFNRMLKSYSMLEDKLRMSEVALAEIAAKIAAYRNR